MNRTVSSKRDDDYFKADRRKMHSIQAKRIKNELHSSKIYELFKRSPDRFRMNFSDFKAKMANPKRGFGK